MFGLIVAGRLVQTDARQVDANKYVFDLPDANQINHVVVFLTGAQPFPPGLAATVHFYWPTPTDPHWQTLGMLSNDKPSAVFRVAAKQHLQDYTHIVAELGLSLEPEPAVRAQVAQLPARSQDGAADTGGDLAVRLAQSLFSYCASFADMSADAAVIPARALRTWFDTVQRKLQYDPSGAFLQRAE